MPSTAAAPLHTATVRAALKRHGLATVNADSRVSPFGASGILCERVTEFVGKQHVPTGQVKISRSVNAYATEGTRKRVGRDFVSAVGCLKHDGYTVTDTIYGYSLVSR